MAKLSEEDWLARRRMGVGGSDISAILGISPFKTPLNIWLDKTGRAAPTPPTLRQEVGHALEPLAAKKYTADTGRAVRKCNVLLKGDCHRVGNVDRLCVCENGKLPWSRKLGVVTDRALEIKTTGQDEWDDVPEYYKAQALHYMGLMPTVMEFDFPVIFTGRMTFKVYTVKRDDATIENLKELAERFWKDYVLTDKPPPATSEEDAKLLWPYHSDGKVAVASSEIEEAVGKIRALRANIRCEEQEVGDLTFKVQSAMQDAETLMLPDQKTKLCTWKNNKPTEKVDYEAILLEVAQRVHFDPDELGEIASRHRVIRDGARVFRLS